MSLWIVEVFGCSFDVVILCLYSLCTRSCPLCRILMIILYNLVICIHRCLWNRAQDKNLPASGWLHFLSSAMVRSSSQEFS